MKSTCLLCVFPTLFTGCGSNQTISESPTRTRIAPQDYTLWRVSLPDQATGAHAPINNCPLVIQKFHLPDLACSKTQSVNLSPSISLETIVHWRGAFRLADGYVETAKATLASHLPPLEDIEADTPHFVGALDSTEDYVLGFVYAPEFQSNNCGMGFARYRLTSRTSVTAPLDWDACLQGIRGEFSGFVNDSSNLAYFVSRTMSMRSDGEIEAHQELMAITKSSSLAPMKIDARIVTASPDGTSVAVIAVPEPKTVVINLFDAGMQVRRWTMTEDLLDSEEMVGLDALWSSDSRLLTITLGDGDSPGRLLILNSAQGRLIAHTAMPADIFDLYGAATIIVPEASVFDPFKYFAMESCN